MTFWTFLDRNIFWVAIAAIMIGGSIWGGTGHGEGSGCHVRCGNAEVSVPPSDGGAP